VRKLTSSAPLGELESIVLMPSSPHPLRDVPSYRCPVAFAANGQRLAAAADVLAVWDVGHSRPVGAVHPNESG